MSESNSPWVGLTARIVRVVLARKDVSYAKLVSGLSVLGYKEDEKALAARVTLGRVRLSLFLQILYVADCKVPPLWADVFSTQVTWEERAQLVIAAERRECPLITMHEITSKLTALGSGHTEKTLSKHVSSGEIFLPVFLRLLVIIRSPSLEFFADSKDLLSVALQSLLGDETSGLFLLEK